MCLQSDLFLFLNDRKVVLSAHQLNSIDHPSIYRTLVDDVNLMTEEPSQRQKCVPYNETILRVHFLISQSYEHGIEILKIKHKLVEGVL